MRRPRGRRDRTPWGVGVALAEKGSNQRGWHQHYSQHTTESAALKTVPKVVEALKAGRVSLGISARQWHPIYIFIWNENKPHPGQNYAYEVELHKFDLDGDDMFGRPEKVT